MARLQLNMSMRSCLILAALVALQFTLCTAFSPLVPVRTFLSSNNLRYKQSRLSASFDDFDFIKDDNDMESIFTSLQERQRQLQESQSSLSKAWKQGQCTCKPVVLDDWVRRISVDYPLVACGTASGNVCVAHLETRVVIAQTNIPEDELDEDKVSDSIKQKIASVARIMYGSYDGGGTLAIAFCANLLVEARRTGGVHLWRLDTQPARLVSQGKLECLGKDVLATALAMDNDYLWVGLSDGRVQAYSLDEGSRTDEQPLALQKPVYEWELEQTITSMSVVPLEPLVVVTTSGGLVYILSYDDDEEESESESNNEKQSQTSLRRPAATVYPPWETSGRSTVNPYATSALLVQMTDSTTDYSLVCAGNEGSMFIQPISLIESSPRIQFTRPLRPLRPSHFGCVPSLSTPMPGMFVSGGRDGRIRIWALQENVVYTGDPTIRDDAYECVVQLLGYKVWLGSVWTDGEHLMSDGSDNSLLVHTFKARAEEPKKKDTDK
jgi:WD40 repeat protein